MYIRIFDDGPRACGADTLEWYPYWYVLCKGMLCDISRLPTPGDPYWSR